MVVTQTATQVLHHTYPAVVGMGSLLLVTT